MALRALGFPVKKAEVLAILQQYNKDQSGQIEANEFQAILTAKLLYQDKAEQLGKAFQLFDLDGTGKISVHNLRAVARELGQAIDEADLVGMVTEFDTDKDGCISEAEFMQIMHTDEA